MGKKRTEPRWPVVTAVVSAFVVGAAVGALMVFTIPVTHVRCSFELPESFGIPLPSTWDI